MNDKFKIIFYQWDNEGAEETIRSPDDDYEVARDDPQVDEPMGDDADDDDGDEDGPSPPGGSGGYAASALTEEEADKKKRRLIDIFWTKADREKRDLLGKGQSQWAEK